MTKKYNLSRLKTVDEINVSISIALHKKNEYKLKKINLERKIKEAENSYPKLLTALEAMDLEIASYENELQTQLPSERITELQSYLATAKAERESLMQDQKDMSIPKTQHLRLLAVLEQINMDEIDILLSELEEKKKELENNSE